jgi:hypothetical protein
MPPQTNAGRNGAKIVACGTPLRKGVYQKQTKAEIDSIKTLFSQSAAGE